MSSLPPSPSPSSRSHSSAEVEEQLLSPQAPHDSSDTEGREDSTSPGNPPQPSAALPGEDNTNSNSDTTAQDLIEEAEVEAQLLIKELDVTDDEFIKLEKRLIGHSLDASTDISNIKAMIKTLRDAVMTKSQFLRQKKKDGFHTYTVSLSRIKEEHIESMGLPNSQRKRVSEQIFKERVLVDLLKPENEVNLAFIREWNGLERFSDTLNLIKKHLSGYAEARSRFAVDQFILEILRLFRTPAGLYDITVSTELTLSTPKHPTIFDNIKRERATIVNGRGDYVVSSYQTEAERPFPFQALEVIVSYTDLESLSHSHQRVAVMMIETKNLALKDLTPYLDQVIGEAMVIMKQSEVIGEQTDVDKGAEKMTPEPVSICLTNSEIWIFGVVAYDTESRSYRCKYTDPIKEGSTHSITDIFHAFALWATVPGETLDNVIRQAMQ